MSRRVSTILATIVLWHLSSLLLMFAYRSTVGPLVLASYTVLTGDIDRTNGLFSRIAAYVGIAVVTLLATAVSLWSYNLLVGKRPQWGYTAIAFVAWESIVIILLVCSYEFGFASAIHQFDWHVFGPPREIYGVRNLLPHRIADWLICTTPAAWVTLYLYHKSAFPVSLVHPHSNQELKDQAQSL